MTVATTPAATPAVAIPALSPDERQALFECIAAADESLRYGGTGGFRTRDLSGTREQRSARMLRRLAGHGLLRSEKAARHAQAQYRWTVTARGRAVAAQL